MPSGAVVGSDCGIVDFDLNCDTVPILENQEAGLEDALVSTGGLVIQWERGKTLEGCGDEKKECEIRAVGREIEVVGNGGGSVGSDIGGENEDCLVSTVVREDGVDSHVGKLLEVELGEGKRTMLTVFSASGCKIVEVPSRIIDLRDESSGDQGHGTDVDNEGVAGTAEDSHAVFTCDRGVGGERLEGSSILRKERVAVQTGLVDRNGQVVDEKHDIEELVAESIMEVVIGERASANLVVLVEKVEVVAESNDHSMLPKDGSGSYQKQETGINADVMVKDDQLGSREGEDEFKSDNTQFLEVDKEEEGGRGLIAVSTEGFEHVEASNHSMNFHDCSLGDQKGRTDFDAVGVIIDDGLGSRKMELEVVSFAGKLSELNTKEKVSPELIIVSAEGFGLIRACSQRMHLEDESDQILENNLDSKGIVETNEDYVSVPSSCGGKILESNEEKGSEDLFAISTELFGPIKGKQATDLADGPRDFQILEAYVDANHINEASVSVSGGICGRLLQSNKEEKGSAELVDISTKVFEPVKASGQSINFVDGSGDVHMTGTNVAAKSEININEDFASSSVGAGVNFLELDREEKRIAELSAVSTKMFEIAGSPVVDLADGYGDVKKLVTDANANDMAILSEESVSISGFCGGKLLELNSVQKGNSELLVISSEVLESFKGSSQGIVLRDGSGVGKRQGTDLEEEVMVGTNEDSFSVNSGGKLLKLEKEGTESVDISTDVFELVKIGSQFIDLAVESGNDQRLGTDVEASVIIRNNEDPVVISRDGGNPKNERLVVPLFMRKEQVEVRGDSEDGRCHVVDDKHSTGSRENEVKSYVEGCMDIDMMEKASTRLVAASAEWSDSFDARALDLEDGPIDDKVLVIAVASNGMSGTDDSLTVSVCGEGPDGGLSEYSTILREEKCEVHVGLVDGSGHVLDCQLCPGEREAEVESHGRTLFEVDMVSKEKSGLVAVSVDELEAFEASNQVMHLGDESCGGQQREVDVDVEGLVLDGQLSPGKRDIELKSHNERYLRVNKGVKGSAELVAFSSEGLKLTVASSHAMYFGDGSDGDEEGGAVFSSEAMVVDVEAEVQPGRNILELDCEEKGSAELFSAETDGHAHVKPSTKAMRMEDGSVGDQRLVSNLDAEAMVITGENSVVNDGPMDERLEESLVVTKEQIQVQGDLVNGSGYFVHGELFTGKWEAEVRSCCEKPVEVDIGGRESTKLVPASTEWSEVVESSSQTMDLGDVSNSHKKQEIDNDAEGVVGNELPVTVSVAIEAPGDESLESSFDLGKDQVMVLEHLVDECCQFVESENPGERGNEFGCHDGRALEVELGEKRKELIAISTEGVGTVEVSHEAIDLGNNYQTLRIDVNAEGIVGTSDGSTVSAGSGVPVNESFGESSIVGTDHVVFQKSEDGCVQVAESELIYKKGLLVIEEYDGKLLEVKTEEKGAELFAFSMKGSETVEAYSEAMDVKDRSGGDQQLGTDVETDCKVGSNEDDFNVSGASCHSKERLEGPSHLKKGYIEAHKVVVDACLDDPFSHQKGEDEVELVPASISSRGLCAAEASSQAMGLEDGYSYDQKQRSNNDPQNRARTVGDSVAISIDGRGPEDETLVMSLNLVKKEVESGEEINEICTAVEDLTSMKTEVIGVDMIIHAAQIQSKYADDHKGDFPAETIDGREEEATCTISGGGRWPEDECLETSYRFGENQVDDEEDNSKTGSSKKILAYTEKVGKYEVIDLSNAGDVKDTDHREHAENLCSRDGFDCDNMLETRVEADAVPLVAPVTYQGANAQVLGRATKSGGKQVEVSSYESQVMEKVPHRSSMNAVVFEGLPCKKEDDIGGTNDDNQSAVSSEFSAGDQNMMSKGLAYLSDCVEAANDSMDHTHALDETVVTYKKHDISVGTLRDAALELAGGETGLTHYSMVDSNQVETHASLVENDQKIYDKNNNVAGETLQGLVPISITEEVGLDSHEVEGEIKITVVGGDNIGDCDVVKTAMPLDVTFDAGTWSACRHAVDDNMLDKRDAVMEGNGLVTGIIPAEQQNVSAQQNDKQNPKEYSSVMVSFRVVEAHAADIMEERHSLSGINIPDASAELDNQIVLPPRNEPSIGCQGVQSSDVPSMVLDGSEPEHGIDESIIGCRNLRDGKSEHLESCSDWSTEPSSTSQQATYNLSFPEKEGFSNSDLVWGKVKSHPWWPGQIFDFSGASKLALKYQKKDHLLVAYFGDKTFAWCEESCLKPFQLHFLQLEKQASSDSFLRAVYDILVEVSRRIELSMTCLCLPEEMYADIEYQKVENAGVRGKTVSSVVDKYEVVNCFHPDKLLDYIRDLAQFPTGGADRLELIVAQAQLKAYYLFKGYTELPSFTNGSGLVENDFELNTSMSKRCKEDDLDYSATLKVLFSTKGKLRVRDEALGKQKHIVEDGRKQKNLSELMEEETASVIINGNENASVVHGDQQCPSSGNKRKILGYFSNDIDRIKTKKIDFSSNKETKFPSPTSNSSFKVGEFISKAACKLTNGQPLRKCYGGKADDWTMDYMDIDDFLEFPFDNPKLQVDISEEYPPAREILSKLCLAARNPLRVYNFSSIVISFFSSFRNLQVSNFSEMNKTEKSRAKRGRKKKVLDLESPDTSIPDHMKDSYWYDMVVPEKDAILNPPKQRGRKKRKFVCESSPLQMLNSPLDCDPKFHIGSMRPHVKHMFIADRPIITVEEKIIDERTPTAVILYFNCSDSLPSDIDLIRIFSRYGPLKEQETSIETKTNSAMVVFKKCADAEMAFSSAGKFSTFGPALLSYRLKHFPAKSSPVDTVKVENHATVIKAEPDNGSASDINLYESIPPVRLEGVDWGPSYCSQTHEDASNIHAEIRGAEEFSGPSQAVLVQTETGIISDNLLLESLDQELSYFDLDIAECGDVSGNMRPVEVVTETSSFLPGQLENQAIKEKSSQLESIDQELHTLASRGEAKDMHDESDISRTQPKENVYPDQASGHVGAIVSGQNSVTKDAMEIRAISEVPSSSIAAQVENSLESVSDKKNCGFY